MRYGLSKKSYVRVFLSLSILFVIVIAVYSYFLLGMSTNSMYSQVYKITKDKTEKLADNMDFVFKKLKLYSINIYEDTTIRNWIFSSGKTAGDDVRSQIDMLRTVTNYLANEPFIERIYIVSMKREEVFDSKKGLLKFANFKDTQILDKIKSNRAPYLKYFSHTVDGSSYITLLLPAIPYNREKFG